MSSRLDRSFPGRFIRWVEPSLQSLLRRDLRGARLRLVLFVLLLAAYWFGLATAADFPRIVSSEWLNQIIFPINVFIDFVTSFAAPQLLRHVIPIAGGLYLAFRLGASYLTDLHELESGSIAYRYLISALFGIGHDRLKISDGDLQNLNQSSPLLRLGGPGYLDIMLGFAAVTEDHAGHPNVYGPQRRRFIRGFERLRDIVDLRDQLRQVPSVRAMTADGIEIQARDVQMVFRVYGGEQERNLQAPYPYTDEAVRRLVYGQPVSDAGPRRWTSGLDQVVTEQVRTFVGSLRLDQMLAMRPGSSESTMSQPSFHISRRKLTERFHTEEAARRLREAGLELIWAGVGTWEVSRGEGATDIEDALVEAWKISKRLEASSTGTFAHRQQAVGKRRAILGPISALVTSWNTSDQVEPDRSSRALSTFYESLLQQESGPDDIEAGGPPVPELTLEHLKRFAERRGLSNETS